MTGNNPTIEVLSGPERRRRWTTAEKLAMVQETYAPDVTVSLVARRNGVQPNQLFHWRKLAAQGALTATAAEGEVVAAAEYRALQNQVRQLQRLLGKKTMEAEILKDALELAAGSKNRCCGRCRGRRTVRDEGRVRDAWRRSVQHRRTFKGARIGPTRPSSRARRRIGRRHRGGHQGPADLRLPPRPRRAAEVCSGTPKDAKSPPPAPGNYSHRMCENRPSWINRHYGAFDNCRLNYQATLRADEKAFPD